MSMLALETDDKDDDTQWLTYWVVFSAFNFVEAVSDVLFNWIPLYYLAKTGLMIWCMHPEYKVPFSVFCNNSFGSSFIVIIIGCFPGVHYFAEAYRSELGSQTKC